MPELVRAIRPGDRLPSLSRAPPVDPPAQARGRPHPQLEGRHPRPGRRLGRAGPGGRPHDPRPAVRAFGIAAQEPALHRPRTLGRPALPRDRRRLRRDGRAGPGRRGRPPRAVSRPSTAGWTSTPSSTPLALATRSAASWAWPTTRSPSAPSPASSSGRGTTTSSPPPPRSSRANPKVRFVFIGDGILRDRLMADAERLGVRHAIHFTGLVPPDRIPELLNAIDAVVHPSLREGLARVLPQALLVGRPVISYDVDGAREVVLPETGILLPPRSIDGLKAGDPPAGGRPGAARRDGPRRAGRRFADQFRHETMTDQLRSLYERLLARPGQSRPTRRPDHGELQVLDLPLVDVEARDRLDDLRRRTEGRRASRRPPRPASGTRIGPSPRTSSAISS